MAVAAASKSLKLEQSKSDVNHLFGLEVQGASVKCVKESVSSKNIEIRASTIDNLPTHLFKFAQGSDASAAANLKRQNRVQDASCPLCAKGTPQTNTFYPTAAAPQRFIDTQSVITTFCQY